VLWQVYRDTYQLILKVFEYTKEFSKEYKYTLGQDMKRDALQLVRSILQHLLQGLVALLRAWYAFCALPRYFSELMKNRVLA